VNGLLIWNSDGETVVLSSEAFSDCRRESLVKNIFVCGSNSGSTDDFCPIPEVSVVACPSVMTNSSLLKFFDW
jgi:hypothetical protein